MVDTLNPAETAPAVYETSNTALVAYLDSSGFKDWDMSWDTERAKFVFHSPLSALEPYIRDFQMARAEGNVVLFYESYKRILGQLKNK